MIELSIPGKGDFILHHVVFDVNGTLALDGGLLDGVADRFRLLADQLEIHLLTADTHGKQAKIDQELGLTASRVTQGQEREQKADYVIDLESEHVVAVGNGSNDALMLEVAAIGIAVIGTEGLSVEALQSADLVCGSITDALDLLLNPKRLMASLRR